MAFPTELKTLRGETRGQRTVMVVGKYEDGTEFAEMLPEGQAEIFVELMAYGLFPVELEGKLADFGIDITDGIIDLRSKRVVSVRIKYSEAESKVRPRSKEGAEALALVTEDVQINPLYEQRKPLLQ